MNVKLEICVDSFESVRNASLGGADRVELCSNLFEGGTTPPLSLIEECKKQNIDIMMMVRPRGGDFCYSDSEYNLMLKDTELAKRLNLKGVVFGILHKDGSIDIARTQALVQAAYPLECTFHRAFDMCSDMYRGLEDVISTGCSRILTSGGKQTAPEGVEVIKSLVAKAGTRISIMAGSGVNTRNAETLIKETGVKEVHFSARRLVQSEMEYKNESVNMGGIPDIPEYARYVSDRETIKEMKTVLKNLQ